MRWTLGHARLMSFTNKPFVFPQGIKIACTFLKCSDCNKRRNALTFNLRSPLPSIGTFPILDRWGKDECLQHLRQRWMSPTFAHSSKSVYLFPISHSNKFHNCSNDNINLHCIAQICSQCAWLGYKNGGSWHCDWLIHHCAGLVSWRIMWSAHIAPEYMMCTIDDIA